jgi:hypothetical protein
LPAIGIRDPNAVVVVDDGIIAAGRRVREADGCVAGYGAHGSAREKREAAGARRRREEK